MKIINPYRFGSGAFSPSDISGLVLWVDASDISTLFTDSAKTTAVASDGDLVGAWEDKSGLGHDLLATNTAYRPTYQTSEINSLAAVYADDTDFLRATFTLEQEYWAFIVAKTLEEELNGQVIGGVSGNFGAVYRKEATTLAQYSGTIGATISVAAAETVLITAKFAGASSSLQKNTDTPVATSPGTSNPGGVTMFNSNAASPSTAALQGFVGELLVYDATLSAGNVSSIQDYLLAKWGIT